jgi:hypothetical protein
MCTGLMVLYRLMVLADRAWLGKASIGRNAMSQRHLTAFMAASLSLLASVSISGEVSIAAPPLEPRGRVVGSLELRELNGGVNTARASGLLMADRSIGRYVFDLSRDLRLPEDVSKIENSVWLFRGSLTYRKKVRGKTRTLRVSALRLEVAKNRITAMYRGRRWTIASLTGEFAASNASSFGKPFNYAGPGILSKRLERAVFRVTRRHSRRKIFIVLKLSPETIRVDDGDGSLPH